MSSNQVLPDAGTESVGSTRRVFHLAAIYAAGAVIALLMAIPTILYLLVPPRMRRESNYVDAGDVSQLKQGSPMEISFRESRLDGWKVTMEKKTAWVVKEADDRIVAFAPQCTHLGCAYHWESAANGFVCPCHGSLFSIDGKVLTGPASRPLDQYQTRCENNRLQIGQLRPRA